MEAHGKNFEQYYSANGALFGGSYFSSSSKMATGGEVYKIGDEVKFNGKDYVIVDKSFSRDWFIKKNKDDVAGYDVLEHMIEKTKMAIGGAVEIGDAVEIELINGKILKGKLEKINPIKIRTDQTSTQVISNALIKSIKVSKSFSGSMATGGKVKKESIFKRDKDGFMGGKNEKVYQAMIDEAKEDKKWAEKKVKEVGREWKWASEVSKEMLNEYLDKSVEQIAKEHYNYLFLRAHSTGKVYGMEQPIDKPAKEKWEKLSGKKIKQ